MTPHRLLQTALLGFFFLFFVPSLTPLSMAKEVSCTTGLFGIVNPAGKYFPFPSQGPFTFGKTPLFSNFPGVHCRLFFFCVLS